MNKRYVTLIFLSLFFVVLYAESGFAQQTEIRQANQLFRSGNHDEALEIYRELLRRNPGNERVVDHKSNALISIKEYEDAIRVLNAFLERRPDNVNFGVRVAETWHMAGDREKAFEAWDKIIEHSPANIQAYRMIAESMTKRREYVKASETLNKARTIMGNMQLFAFDIARNYTAAGEFEKAMQEYSRLLIENSGFLQTIQRHIARFDDEFFRDAAIMEFEELSRELTPGSEEWTAHRNMLIWLYTERKLYRRALATARNLEARLNDGTFPLFEVGRMLFNVREFDLAEEAFQTYSTESNHPLFAESREQLALLYIDRARYLIDNNLDFGTEANRLYQKAYDLLEELESISSNYQIRPGVLTLLTEISLDYLKDAELARDWQQKFSDLRGRQASVIMADYLLGRIYMFEQDFTRARITLTRSNRAARSGNLAEKTRYFLSLNDFYAGDFEFSKIQMRSLRRQATSYYANDALRLRSWLQEGMVEDSATVELRNFSEARFNFDSGKYNEALASLEPFFSPVESPMKTEAVILSGIILRQKAPELGFLILNRFTEEQKRSTQREHIMWTRTRLADALVKLDQQPTPEEIKNEIPRGFWTYAGFTDENSPAVSLSLTEVLDLYENIIIEFPRGMYATPARERIRTLQQMTMTP